MRKIIFKWASSSDGLRNHKCSLIPNLFSSEFYVVISLDLATLSYLLSLTQWKHTTLKAEGTFTFLFEAEYKINPAMQVLRYVL